MGILRAGARSVTRAVRWFVDRALVGRPAQDHARVEGMQRLPEQLHGTGYVHHQHHLPGGGHHGGGGGFTN